MVPPLKEVRTVKRLFALAASTIAALALAIIPAASAASAQSDACSDGAYFLIDLENLHAGVNNGASPYTLRTDAGSSETTYCKPGSSGSYNFEQTGTSRCLNVDTTNATITEGNCALVRARWDTIADGTFMGTNVWMIENDYIDRCIYSTGLGSSDTYGTCDGSNYNDVFLIH
jgi:hypothetical protein